MAVFTNQMRFTGMSGLEVNDMVTQLMRAHSVRLDRMRQNRQILVWQQEMLLNQAAELRGFRDRTLALGGANGPASIRLPSNFDGTTISVLDGNGEAARGVSVTGTASGTQRLRVEQYARGETFRSESHNQSIRSTSSFNLNQFAGDGGFEMRVELNGRTQTISIPQAAITAMQDLPVAQQPAAFIDRLNQELENAFGSDVGGGFNPGTRAYLQNTTALPGGPVVGAPDSDGYGLNADGDRVLAPDGRRILYVDDGSGTLVRTYITDTEGYRLNSAGERITDPEGYMINAEGNRIVDPNMQGNRQHVWASFETSGGQQRLVVHGRQGNTVTLMNSTNTNAPTLQQMGFTQHRRPDGTLANPSTSFDPSNNSMVAFMDNEFGVFNFEINGRHFNFDGQVFTTSRVVDGQNVTTTLKNVVDPANLTIQDVLNAVNNSDAGVRMSFSQTTGSFTMESTEMGVADGRIEFSGATFFSTLGFGASHNNSSANRITEAQDAVVYLNGSRFVRNTNNFTIDGLNITLDPTRLTSQLNGTDPLDIYISFERDTAPVLEIIKNFVEEYNALIRSIRDLTETSRPRATGGGRYMPLTDEQRAGMSDREIELWEEQARTGLLSRDDTLRRLTSDLHRAIFQDVPLDDGRTINLLQLGIRTNSDLSRFGELQIDEERLEAFINSNLDDVKELFTRMSEVTEVNQNDPGERGRARTQRINESGIGQRINDIIQWQLSHGGGLNGRVGATSGEGAPNENNRMASRLRDEDRRIDDLLRNLQRREGRYFEMFGRLEAAMIAANSQMMFMEQMFWMA